MDIPYFPMGVSAQCFRPTGSIPPLVAETARILPHFEVFLQAKQGTEISLGFSS